MVAEFCEKQTNLFPVKLLFDALATTIVNLRSYVVGCQDNLEAILYLVLVCFQVPKTRLSSYYLVTLSKITQGSRHSVPQRSQYTHRDSVVGDVLMGVRANFDRFYFDADILPLLLRTAFIIIFDGPLCTGPKWEQ